MDAAIAHLQENPVAYGIIAVCLIPLLYLTRRVTAPIFFYSVEILLYSALFHLAFGGAVRFLSWFKDQSEFRNWDTSVIDVNFTTPITNFWMRDQYSPQWLFTVECVVFIIIVFVVIYFRPMNIGAKNRYQGQKDRFGERRYRGAGRPGRTYAGSRLQARRR